MAKKRKSDASRLEEVDRSMYTTFCSAANSLSQLYSQTMHHQRLSFQAGERHAMEKFYNWVLRQEEAGARVSSSDMMAYMQNVIEYGPTDEAPISPRLPTLTQQQQQSQTPIQISNSGIPISANSFDQQAKYNVFTNALSSPLRRSLQNHHLAQNKDLNPSSNDSVMDMHADDSPSHESSY